MVICKGDDDNVVTRWWVQRGEATLGRSSHGALRDDKVAEKWQTKRGGEGANGAGEDHLGLRHWRRWWDGKTLCAWVQYDRGGFFFFLFER